MARTLTQHDIDVLGYYVESTKGTAKASTTYIPLRGIVQSLSWRDDPDRKNRKLDGRGPMDQVQTIGHETVSGELEYLVSNDYDTTDSTTVLNFLSLLMGTNSLHSATGRVLTRGTRYIAFTNGVSGLAVGYKLTGATSSATGLIKEVLITSGSLASSDAVGLLVLDKISGAFQSSENLQIGGATKAVSSAANTEIWSQMDSFTLWVKEKFDTVRNHVFAGCHVTRLTYRFNRDGEIAVRLSFQALSYSSTAPSGSTLPSEPELESCPPFRWTSSDGAVTLTRAGTYARVEEFEINLENQNMHFCPLAGQNTAEDLVPGGLSARFTLTFRVIEDTPYTTSLTSPNSTKTLAYDGQTGNFTVGARLMGRTSGATAYIVADSDSGLTGTLTLRDIQGVFQNDEALVDDSTGVAVVNGVLTDAGTIDFIVTLSKATATNYIRFACYNVPFDGAMSWENNFQDDSIRTFQFSGNILGSNNLIIDVRG